MTPGGVTLLVTLTTVFLLQSARAVNLPRQGSLIHPLNNHPGPIRPQDLEDIRLAPLSSSSRLRRSASDAILLQNTISDVNDENEQYPVAGAEVKRRWNSGRNMAVWGKRGTDVSDSEISEEKRKWTGDRKMALWGKRSGEEVTGKLRDAENAAALENLIHNSGEKRKWGNGNRMELWGKRKWLSRNMAVWGKRGFDDSEGEESLKEKRMWRGRDMAVWG